MLRCVRTGLRGRAVGPRGSGISILAVGLALIWLSSGSPGANAGGGDPDCDFVPPGSLCDDTDNNPCTRAACNLIGNCDQDFFLLVGQSCPDTDGNECTAAACDASGNCDQNEPDDSLCDDGDACTTDSCDPSTGACSHGDACDDGNPCTSEACGSTGCFHFPSLRCFDGDPCTTDSCDPSTGACSHTVICQ
jgi:hypothetical protein